MCLPLQNVAVATCIVSTSSAAPKQSVHSCVSDHKWGQEQKKQTLRWQVVPMQVREYCCTANTAFTKIGDTSLEDAGKWVQLKCWFVTIDWFLNPVLVLPVSASPTGQYIIAYYAARGGRVCVSRVFPCSFH